MGKQEYLLIAGESENWYSHYTNQCGYYEIEILSDSDTPLFGIHHRSLPLTTEILVHPWLLLFYL